MRFLSNAPIRSNSMVTTRSWSGGIARGDPLRGAVACNSAPSEFVARRLELRFRAPYHGRRPRSRREARNRGNRRSGTRYFGRPHPDRQRAEVGSRCGTGFGAGLGRPRDRARNKRARAGCGRVEHRLPGPTLRTGKRRRAPARPPRVLSRGPFGLPGRASHRQFGDRRPRSRRRFRPQEHPRPRGVKDRRRLGPFSVQAESARTAV